MHLNAFKIKKKKWKMHLKLNSKNIDHSCIYNFRFMKDMRYSSIITIMQVNYAE